MVQSIVKGVVSVTSVVNDTQRLDFEEFDLEFQLGSRWITQALESCKRHIIDSNCIEEESRKRRKAGSISNYITTDEVDKENTHPNVLENGYHDNRQVKIEKNDNVTENPTQAAQDAVIDVMSLKVVELRKLLSERGLDTTGLKKMLQSRLMEDIKKESNSSKDSTMKRVEKESNEITEETIDDYMEEVIEEGNELNVGIDIVEGDKAVSEAYKAIDDPMMEANESEKEVCDNEEVKNNEDVEMVEVEEAKYDCNQKEPTIDSESAKKALHNKTFGAKILSPIRKVFSPNKSKKVPSTNGTHNNGESLRADEAGKTKVSSYEKSHEEEIVSHQQQTLKSKSHRDSIVCNMTVDEIKSATKKGEAPRSDEGSESKQVSSAQVTPGFSLQKVNNATSSSQKLQSMKEARKARLDEMRNKAHSKTLSMLNSNKKQMIKTTVIEHQNKGTDAADRKRKLANQMRQKAADAVKNHGHSEMKSLQAGNKPASPSHKQRQQQPAMTYKEEKKQMSPMETYEMSDRGESDSDDSDYDDRAPKKKIPKWAQRENLRPALERQFLDGPCKLDPDEIFPEVSTCDLEAIFDQRKKRYMKRTSSGNWTKDKVTISEKLVYKRNMGFCK